MYILSLSVRFVEALIKTVNKVIVDGQATVADGCQPIRRKNSDTILCLLEVSALLLHTGDDLRKER